MSTSENKEIVHRYYEGRSNQKNNEVVDQYLTGECIEGEKAWLDE
jgi:hypothetical protein